MGVRTGLANQIARVVAWAVRVQTPPRYGTPLWTGDTAWSDWDAVKAVKEGYKASYIYYTVASDLADCQRMLPWQLKRASDRGAEVVDKHALVNMIRSPNPEMTWGALMELWDLDKSLAGNAYGLIAPLSDDVVVWRLRPDRISIDKDARGHIGQYVYMEGMPGEEKYDPEQILHFKFADPGDDLFGLAPLKAAAKLVDTLNAGVESNYSTVKQGSLPRAMVSPKSPMGPDQYADSLKKFKEQMTGPENARKWLFPAEPYDVTPLSMSPIELDLLRSFVTYEAGCCKVLHVHPEAIGALDAKFENKEWAILAKWAGPVKSRAFEIRAVLNHKFGPLFNLVDPKSAAPGELYLDVDLSDTPDARAAREKRLEKAPKIWACGVPWNQINEQMDLGFEPIEGGDIGYVPATVLPVGMGQEDEGRATRAINPSQGSFRTVWASISRRKAGWERGVAVKVSELFQAERKAVLRKVGKGHVDVDYVIDGRAAAWTKLVSTVARAVIEDFGQQVADELNGGRSVAEDLEVRLEQRQEYEFDPWTEAIQDHVVTTTATHVTEIGETTKRALRGAIKEGLDAGESMTQISKRIGATFADWEGGTSSYRAMLIARTEVHSAAGYAMHESARQSGVAQKKGWLDAGDDRVRDSHAGNTAAGWIDFDDPYPNGAQHPGDGTDDIGCRCVEMFKTR